MTLNGRKIAILIAPRGTEEPEFKQPKDAVEAAGATVTVVGIETGEAETNNNDLDPGSSYQVDKAISEVSAEEFDGLVIPGGCVGADKLRVASRFQIWYDPDITATHLTWPLAGSLTVTRISS